MSQQLRVFQCLSYFHRIEERDSGFRRMRNQMLNHGLDQPLLGTDTGYFQVIFPGPAENLDRIRAPETAPGMKSSDENLESSDRAGGSGDVQSSDKSLICFAQS